MIDKIMSNLKKKSTTKFEELSQTEKPSKFKNPEEAFKEGLARGFWNGVAEGAEMILEIEEELNSDPIEEYRV